MSLKGILGQDKPVERIKEYILQAQGGRSYLFIGPDSIGKKLAAKNFAKALNCESALPDSCGQCGSCLKIEQNQHPDVHFIDEAESDSIKIEEIRRMQKNASLRAYEAKKKFFIIDNAHKLTAEAANALLKTLEEPTEESIIILVSSKPGLLFKTIISRCQILRFYPIERARLCEILKKDYSLCESSAHFLSYFSEGRLGLALKLKDTDIFKEKNKIIDQFNSKSACAFSGLLIKDRRQMRDILNIMAVWFRDLYLLKSGLPQAELINRDRGDDLKKSAGIYTFAGLDQALKCISDSLLRLEQNINIKLLLANLESELRPEAGFC